MNSESLPTRKLKKCWTYAQLPQVVCKKEKRMDQKPLCSIERQKDTKGERKKEYLSPLSLHPEGVNCKRYFADKNTKNES